MNTCPETRQSLECALERGENTPPPETAAHLERCPRCRAWWEQGLRFEETLRRAAERAPAISDAAHTRIAAALEREPIPAPASDKPRDIPQPGRRRAGVRAPVPIRGRWITLAAAALVILAVAGVAFFRANSANEWHPRKNASAEPRDPKIDAGARAGEFSLPDVSLPSVSFPSASAPEIALSEFSRRALSLPAIAIPEVSVPVPAMSASLGALVRPPRMMASAQTDLEWLAKAFVSQTESAMRAVGAAPAGDMPNFPAQGLLGHPLQSPHFSQPPADLSPAATPRV